MGVDTERRGSKRYPIRQQIQYRVASGKCLRTGHGLTINMSSTGILFTTEEHLPEGTWLTVEVGWPVLLDNRTPIKLVTYGRIVRSDNKQAAMHIRSWEFRTQGNPPATQ